MFFDLQVLKKIIYNKHATVICILIWLLFFAIILSYFLCGMALNICLSLQGALFSTLFVFIFIEYSMQCEKERKWNKLKKYSLFILNASSKKFIANFIEFKKAEEITQDTFIEKTNWLEKILNNELSLEFYIGTLPTDYWFDYEKKLVKNYNTDQIEKILDKLIALDVEEQQIIDNLSEFVLAKEKLKYLIGFADYSTLNDPDEHKIEIEKMLIASVRLYNLTMDRS